MKEKILELEESLFKIKYMSDYNYLDNIISDNYLEIGKSGKKFTKEDVINELINLKEDRNIKIIDFTCDKLSDNTYMVHYITMNNNDKIFRTSIWQDNKILFHQASLLKED